MAVEHAVDRGIAYSRAHAVRYYKRDWNIFLQPPRWLVPLLMTRCLPPLVHWRLHLLLASGQHLVSFCRTVHSRGLLLLLTLCLTPLVRRLLLRFLGHEHLRISRRTVCGRGLLLEMLLHILSLCMLLLLLLVLS
jgi:hypothetical protein